MKSLLEGYSKQYVKEQREFEITEEDNEPNFKRQTIREKKLSQNLDLIQHHNFSCDNRKLNMSTQTEITQDIFYANQSSINL